MFLSVKSDYLFFNHKSEIEKPTISQALGESMFNSALISLSLYQYTSCLALLISSFEAFLANIEDSSDELDKRSAFKKWKQFKVEFPNSKKNFRRYSELDEDPDDVLEAALKLRNTIVHSNSSSLNAANVSKIISSGLLPLIQTIYFHKVGAELLDKLDAGLSKMFTTTFFLRKNYDLDGNDWTRILSPLVWYLQYTLSPNFGPKTFYDEHELGPNGDTVQMKALDKLTSEDPLLDTDDNLSCPCCYNLSIAVKYGFPELKGKERISIEELQCVNCNLELGSSPLDQLISETLLDTFLTENEPKLRASFGLR